MSEIRRLNQVKRTIPTLSARVASIMQAHWRKLFSFIGVPGLFDLTREFARGKTMEWIYQNSGTLGVWLASYKLAGFTVGMIIVILWVVVSVDREARQRESIILDHTGNPYQVRTVSKVWAKGTIAASCALVVFLIYGAYRLYVVTPQSLVEKYPLGYVVFDVDHTSTVFPYESKGLDNWEFDWSTVRIVQDDKHIGFTLPNIRSRGSANWQIVNNQIGGVDKKVGPIFRGQRIWGDRVVALRGEILAIRQNGIVLLLGFTPYMQPAA